MPKTAETLEDVLDAYVEATGKPSRDALKEWIQRYPQFKKDLTDFTVNWALMKHLPPTEGAEKTDENTLVLRAMSIVQDRLRALNQRDRDAEQEITDLLAEGKRCGMDVHVMADRCSMSVPVLMKLSQRFISYARIPQEAIENISKAIGRAPDVVAAYLVRPMLLARDAQFHAKSAPKLPEKQEDFFDAIRNDETMDEERRSFWLSFEKREK